MAVVMDIFLHLSHVLVILAIVAPIFIFWKRKRLATIRNSTSNFTHRDAIEMETVSTKAYSLRSAANWEYEVFLSFRGEDTRNNFVSHLYEKLNVKGIYTFKDDKALRRGESISPSLLKAIERSRIAIVVLSRNYACSSWCLDELIKIIECRRTKGQLILPVFYNVDPSDVEEQTGIVGSAFKEHQKKFEVGRVRRWKDALSEVATIAGWDSQKCFDRNEAELIKRIVADVSDKLIWVGSAYPVNLVGINSHMVEIDGLLDLKCNDVRIIGIWGIGGIGKTTIAEFIFNKYSSEFDSYCFLHDVKDKYRKVGDTNLQKELLNQILGDFNKNICTRVSGCDLICRRLSCKKVLIVPDDVDASKQLNALANSLEWFGHGSRIIITTRNKHMLLAKEVNYAYEVQALSSDQSLQLFSRYAFNQNQPQSGFEQLSNDFVSYARGLPLALEVLGTSLCGLEMSEWQSELKKLQGFSNPSIYQVLKISYDGLDDAFVKDVFLDIAFFFVGKDATEVANILCRYGCTPTSAFRILKDRALLTMHKNRFYMHELIQGMAREIVREECRDPCKRSRLWHSEDVSMMLMSGEGTSAIEGISLDMSKMKTRYLESSAFRKLYWLRILKFYLSCHPNKKQGLRLGDDGLDFLPNELRYLQWDSFPARHLPSTFLGENLVELRMIESELEYLWNGEIELENLKIINLSNSTCLKTFPSLSKATNVVEIHLYGCESLVEFSSGLQDLRDVSYLSFEGCTKLVKLPTLPTNLSELHLSTTAVRELSPDVQSLSKLVKLEMTGCESFQAFPMEIGEWASLSYLSMGGAAVKRLPESFCRLESLEHLRLIGVALTILPESIGKLKSLKWFDLREASLIELPESIGDLHQLLSLDLSRCKRLQRLPSSMHKLTKLRKLYVTWCKSLCSLPQLPESISRLYAGLCESLETLEEHGGSNLQNLKTLRLNCCKFDHRTCNEILEQTEVMIRRRIKKVKVGKIYKSLFHCVAPGNNIPSWFDNKSNGSSIMIELPSHRFTGFAFCVVCAFDQYLPDSNDRDPWCDIGIRVTSADDMFKMYPPEFVEFVFSQSEVVDHVMVWYSGIDEDAATDYLGHKVQFNFVADVLGEVKVTLKQCGVYVHPFEFDASDEFE